MKGDRHAAMDRHLAMQARLPVGSHIGILPVIGHGWDEERWDSYVIVEAWSDRFDCTVHERWYWADLNREGAERDAVVTEEHLPAGALGAGA